MNNKNQFIEVIEGLIKRPVMYASREIGLEFFLYGFEYAIKTMNIAAHPDGKMSFIDFCSSTLNLGMRNFLLNFEHNNSCHISFVKDDKKSKALSEQYVNELKDILEQYYLYLEEDN